MARSAWRPDSRRWVVAPPFEGAGALARAAGVPPLVASLLHHRGIDDPDAARAFLSPRLTDLHDPELLGGAAAAAQRIARAVAERRRIVLYGDYDVDGITGVAILHSVLTMVGADVHYYVPHRLEEGYGVNLQAMRKLIADGANLMVTVDCGIGAFEPIAEARAAGVDVIVTDHHTPGETLPDACEIVHPCLPAGQYPNAHLSGAGVAFKLAWQVARAVCGNHRVSEPMKDFLLEATCLAALGTIADVVPLVGENRALAMHGLRGLPAVRRAGVRALIESAGLTGEKIDAYHVGFVLAPRLNACGRMGHARLAVELLTDAPESRCRKIAAYLNAQNAERQRVERAIADEAVQLVRDRGWDTPDHRVLVLAGDDWHSGVVGIVASRLVREFSRPAILIAVNGDGVGQGSARSIPGFHMRDALAACGKHLLSFGGHAMAGGLRIDRANLDAFTRAMSAVGAERITPEQLTPALEIDAETTLAQLTPPAVACIDRMAPFGQGNPAPRLAVRGCRILVPPKRIGRTGSTVSLFLGQGESSLRAVGFQMGELVDALAGAKAVDVVGRPMLNRYAGQTTVELHLEDARRLE